jgi:hypothetical protein
MDEIWCNDLVSHFEEQEVLHVPGPVNYALATVRMMAVRNNLDAGGGNPFLGSARP